MKKKIFVLLFSIIFLCTGCDEFDYLDDLFTFYSSSEVKDISNARITAISGQLYTGKSLTPSPVIIMDGKTLTEGVDYNLNYSNNVEVGTANVIINGIGYYSGSIDTSFKIVKAKKQQAIITCVNGKYTGKSQVIAYCSGGKISNVNQVKANVYKVTCKGDKNHLDAKPQKCTINKADISKTYISKVSNQLYTGSEITPKVLVANDNNVLVEKKDYTVKYRNNKELGVAYVDITGIGNYSGTQTMEFSIKSYASQAQITCVDRVYNGREQLIAFCSGGSISNEFQTEAGKYTVSCIGNADHRGTVTKKCAIEKADLKNALVTSISSYPYTGREIRPEPLVMMNGKQLTKNVNYKVVYKNNIEPGFATITVSGIDNYTGSQSISFRIMDFIELPDKAFITCLNKEYNGEEQVIASCNGGTIKGHIQQDVGSYTVSCKGDSNHKNADSKQCMINRKDISNAFIGKIADQIYTGKTIKPTVVVSIDDKRLFFHKDYELSYKNNVEAGIATIYIEGINNYSGTVSINFNIIKGQLLKRPALITCTNKEYNGETQTIATCSGGTIKGAKKQAVGSYEVNCVGDEYHTNAKAEKCSITVANIADSVISPIGEKQYTGKNYEPSVNIVHKGRKLIKDVDYKLSYKNNKDVGIATVYITGIGSYTGTKETTFSINNGVDTITINYKEVSYTGNEVHATATSKSGSAVTMKYYSDSSCKDSSLLNKAPINAGTYYVTATTQKTVNYGAGKINCAKALVITKASDVLSLKEVKEVKYSGFAERASVKAKSGLNPSIEYYSDSSCSTKVDSAKNAGTYYVTAKTNGNKNYKGGTIKCTKAVVIKKMDIANSSNSEISSQKYTGNEITPQIVVMTDHALLKNNVDYKLKYEDNIKVGTARIIITGIGNYTGSRTISFQITKGKDKALITCLDKQYNDEYQVIATCSGGNISNAKKKDVGSYEVSCSGDSTHLAADKKTCKITKASIASANVSAESKTYTGSALAVAPTVKLNGKTLVYGVDYSLTYNNNVNVGTASVTVNGKGNYDGSKTVSFAITKAKDVITVKVNENVYNGSSYHTTVNSLSKSLVKLTYYSDSKCSIETTELNAVGQGKAPKSAGTYYVKGVSEGSSLYSSGTLECSKAVVIKKAYDDITINPKTYIYNGKGVSTEATAKSKSGVTITYYKDSKCTQKTTVSEAVSEGGAPKNVGNYYVIAKSVGNVNYIGNTSSCTLAVTINKASDVVTIKHKSSKYTGSAVTAEVTTTSKSKTSIVYYSDSKCSKKTTTSQAVSEGGAPKVSGSYYAIAKSEGNSNYYAGSTMCSLAITIEATLDTITITPKTVDYSSTSSAGVSATITNVSKSKITATYYSDSACKNKTTTSNAVSQGGAPNKVGVYYVIAKSDGNASYSGTTSKCTKAVTIKAIVTFYGASSIETGISDGVVLPGSQGTPERRSVDLSLSKNTQYIASFDYKLIENTNDTNQFNVDLHEDPLPQIKEPLTATKNLQHYDWIIEKTSLDKISNCRLRFFDDVDNSSSEKDIVINNIFLGTIKRKSIEVGSKLEAIGLDTPTRIGYTFDGWYKKNSDGTETKVSLDTVVNSNLSLYARFKKKTKELFVISSNYDNIVSDISVVDFGADKTGEKDSTKAFNLALRKAQSCLVDGSDACGKNANGVVYVPMGKYKITKPLIIEDRVTLVGYLPKKVANGTTKLIDGKTINGSVLMIYGGKDTTNNASSAIKLGTQSQLKNLAFWYPEQQLKPDNTYHEYPPTILQTGIDGITLENLLLINPYIGIDLATYNPDNMWGKPIQFVKDIYGSPLSLGLVNDVNLDTIKIDNLQFSPKFWEKSGVSGAPTTESLTTYLKNKKATALSIKRVDWYMLSNLKIDGYYYGLHLAKSTDKKVVDNNATAEGALYDSSITNTYYPIYSETVHHTAITKTTLSAAGVSGSNNASGATGLYVASDADISINSCTITSSGTNAIFNNSSKAMSIVNSKVTKKIVRNKPTSKGITLVSNTLSGTGYESVNHPSQTVVAPPTLGYSDKKVTKPGSNNIKVIDATKNEDITSKVKEAINALGSEGGIVYIPAGTFKISGPITIKSKVEIRGSTPLAHYAGGTVINTSYFKGPLFTLNSSAGLNGITIHYTQINNPYDSKWKDYKASSDYTKTFAIKGNGSNIYIANIAILNGWSGIDLRSVRCDNHFVEHIWGAFLEVGIAVGAGSENGIIRDNHFTINVMEKGSSEVYERNLKYMGEHEAAYVIQESKNEILLNNFVFGARYGFYVANSTNSYVINGGADSSIKGLNIKGTVKNGYFINMMLVTKSNTKDKRPKLKFSDGEKEVEVNYDLNVEENNYITTDNTFKGYVNLVNAMCWGNNSRLAYNLDGQKDSSIHISGGIMENGNADKSFIKANNTDLLVAGTIFRISSSKEFTNSRANSSTNYIGPLCYDGKCNINKTNSTASTYLKDSCIVK